MKKSIAPSFLVSYTLAVPDQPSPDSDTITVRLSRQLKKRLQALAKSRSKSLTDVVVPLIEEEVRGVVLTSDDYELIAKQVRAAEQKLEAKKWKS